MASSSTPSQGSTEPASRTRRPVEVPASVNQARQSHPSEATASALARSLAGHRPIAFNINLARIAGDVKAGLLLSQLLYWTRVGVDVEKNNGWIFKTREQWEVETGLSRQEQLTARTRLIKLGLIREALIGSPARLTYKIMPAELGMALANLVRSEPVQWTLFDLRNSEQTIRALLGRSMQFYKVFVDALGSVPVALFATKALMVQKSVNAAQLDRSNKARKATAQLHLEPNNWEQNWFCLSSSLWTSETGLRPGQIRQSKQYLCQLNILQEAFYDYPKRKLFLRMNIDALNQRLILMTKEMLARQIGGNTKGANAFIGNSGLMASLIKAASGKINSSPLLIQNEQAITGESFVQIEQVNSPPAKIPENALDIASSPSKSLCFPQVVNPVSRFEQARFRVIAPQKASFNTKPGEFQQLSMRVSAPLHARAVFTTTDLTTTTTTDQGRSEISPQFIRSVDNSDRVDVVVGVFKKQKSEDQSQIPKPENLPKQTAIAQATERFLYPVRLVEQFAEDVAKLIWPNELSETARAETVRLLKPIPELRKQALIDELAGNLGIPGRVRSPIAYIRKLIEREINTPDGLVLELASQVKDRRERQLDVERRISGYKLPNSIADGLTAASQDEAVTKPPPPEVREKMQALRQKWKAEKASLNIGEKKP